MCENKSKIHVLNSAPLHEGTGGSRGAAPKLLNLSTRCRYVVSFMPYRLYSGKISVWITK
jgi:hypothetical protein